MPYLIVPDESHLLTYLSSCLLGELQVALQLGRVNTLLESTGQKGIEPPQLVVEHPAYGWMTEVICATPLQLDGPNLEWWFEWRSFRNVRLHGMQNEDARAYLPGRRHEACGSAGC
jgi:hypothetical protein